MKQFFVTGIPAIVILGMIFLSFSKNGVEDDNESVQDSLRVMKFEPSVTDDTDMSSFHVDSKNYYLDASIESSWNAYRNIRPEEAWQGQLVS